MRPDHGIVEQGPLRTGSLHQATQPPSLEHVPLVCQLGEHAGLQGGTILIQKLQSFKTGFRGGKMGKLRERVDVPPRSRLAMSICGWR
jgi:hypothetical protein